MIQIGGIVLAKLRFPDPAGQLQDREDKAALAVELGDNYARYHQFLRDEIAKLPGLRPKAQDYSDVASYLRANEWSEDIVKAEVILRKCRAFQRSGARLAAYDDSGLPVVDRNDRLVGLS